MNLVLCRPGKVLLSEAHGVNDPTTPATLFQGCLHTTMRGNHGVCVSVTVHDYYNWHWVTYSPIRISISGSGNIQQFPDGCNAVRGISRHGSTVGHRAVRAVSSRSLDCE